MPISIDDPSLDPVVAAHLRKELLRLVVVGSVDDGKSTLIGRLLYETHGAFEDQIADAKKASLLEDGSLDFSLLTDGLKAEREQGITIDVAYRYFQTEKRKFIIADTPGHVQYTRNMATGASTANVGIILIDARLGVLQQSRRHAYIASLLGIRHLAVAVNKMDLRDYDRAVFDSIASDFGAFAEKLGFHDVRFFPVSALKGDNIVKPSSRTPWYDGGTILEYLETVPITLDRNLDDFRFPVQYVLRPNLDYRGFAGQVASGVVRRGDEVLILPSGKVSRVRSIDTFEGELEVAYAPLCVTLRLTEEIDVSRGDMIVHRANPPRVGRSFDAMVVWMSERAHDPGKSYFIKHSSLFTRAHLDRVLSRTDLDTLDAVPADSLALNEIGRIRVTSHRPIFWDPYHTNRGTGAFIVVDSLTNNTVGAGMIVEPTDSALSSPTDDVRAGRSEVSSRERAERLGQAGCVVWIEGLPGSGKSTVAWALERKLHDISRIACVVDPDDESFQRFGSEAAAEWNAATRMLQAAQIAHHAARAGVICICAFTTATATDREAVSRLVGADRIIEVYLRAPADLCRARDQHGAWAQADAAGLPWDEPSSPSLTLDTSERSAESAADAVLDALRKRGVFRDDSA